MTDGQIYLIQHYEWDIDRARRLRQVGMDPDPPEWSGYHKIGRAKNPKKRLSMLKGGTPHKLRLIATVDVEGDVAEAEWQLHELYMNPTRWRGEWFRLTEDDIESFKELEVIRPEIIKKVRDNLLQSDKNRYEIRLIDEIRKVRGEA